jgi:hypothetical protein
MPGSKFTNFFTHSAAERDIGCAAAVQGSANGQYTYIAIDDHSRIAFQSLPGPEKGKRYCLPRSSNRLLQALGFTSSAS